MRNIKLEEMLKFIYMDISDDSNLNALCTIMENVDVVFHLAAMARVQPSIKDPILFNRHNVNATLNVLTAAQKSKVKRFVYSASSSAYGNGNPLPLKEGMPTNPMSPYGLQKLIGEEYCKLFTEVYGLETVCLRYFNVFGERQNSEGAYCTVLGIFSRLMKEGNPLTITNDGEQRRDFTYVGDVVDANILAAESNKVGKGDVINIGSGQNSSVNEIAEIFGGEKKSMGNVLEPRETLADNSKASELLGWTPKVEVKNWLKNYLNGIQQSA